MGHVHQFAVGKIHHVGEQHVEQLGSLPIDTVPVREMRNYIADLRSRTVRYENARQRRQIDGGLSDETIRGHVRCLRRFFKWCVCLRPAKAVTVFCALTPNLIGKPLTLSGLHSTIRRLKKRSGVTGRANPHGWRHHLGWYWLNEGGDLATLSLIMGHPDPATTLRYYAIFMMAEAIKKHRQFSPMRGIWADEYHPPGG